MPIDRFLWDEIDRLHRLLLSFKAVDQGYIQAMEVEAEQMSSLEQNDYLNRVQQAVKEERKIRGSQNGV